MDAFARARYSIGNEVVKQGAKERTMSKYLDRDLTNLQKQILTMAGYVEEAVYKSIQALQAHLSRHCSIVNLPRTRPVAPDARIGHRTGVTVRAGR